MKNLAVQAQNLTAQLTSGVQLLHQALGKLSRVRVHANSNAIQHSNNDENGELKVDQESAVPVSNVVQCIEEQSLQMPSLLPSSEVQDSSDETLATQFRYTISDVLSEQPNVQAGANSLQNVDNENHNDVEISAPVVAAQVKD